MAKRKRSRWKWQPVHSSHRMGRSRVEIRCPLSTPRYYGVRRCTCCHAEQAEHPAGRFMASALKTKCSGKPLDEDDPRAMSM